MAQGRSIQIIHAQEEGSDDVTPPTPAFSTGLQAAVVAFRTDLTLHSERREGAGGGTAAGGGTRFAYRDLGGDPHGFGNNYSQGRVRSLTHVNAGTTVAHANMRPITVENDTEPIVVEDEAMDYNDNLMENGVDLLTVEEMGDEIVDIRDDDENMRWGSNSRHLYSSNSHGPWPHRNGFLHQYGMPFAPPAPLSMAASHTVPPFYGAPQPADMHSVNVVPNTYENGPEYVRGAVGTAGVNNNAAERTYERRRRR